MKERMSNHGVPPGHARREAIAEAGIELVPRVTGIRSSKPLLEDKRVLAGQATQLAQTCAVG